MTAVKPSKPYQCWVVSDGRAGIENQALGLAEAVARRLPLRIAVKRIAIKPPWNRLPRFLWGDPYSKLSPAASLLRPPYPDLWIACGRLSTPFAAASKKRAPDIFCVQIQAPRAALSEFDLVVPPEHDGLKGDNVFTIMGSPGRATTEKFQADAAALAPALAHVPNPKVAVLIGGPNRFFSMSDKRIAEIASSLAMLAASGAGLMLTSSRRTPPGVTKTIAAALSTFPHYAWEGETVAGLDNPYFGMLGLADHVVVTEDSVNMAAEAAVTGKPIHILELDRRPDAAGGAKFRRFHQMLEKRGISRPFSECLEEWTYQSFNETERAAEETARRFVTAQNRR